MTPAATCVERHATGGPAARLLSGGRRLHLQHGPIDLVIEACGPRAEVVRAYAQATECFRDLLATLAAELALLRTPLGAEFPPATGPTAKRMVAACWPHRGQYITPMAAVAGAVADEVLAALLAGLALSRAYVNDGGDIAFHLARGEALSAGIVADIAAPAIFGTLQLTAELPVRGIATSGRAGKGEGGRSFSLGIADSVTVLARDGAAADAAATVIGNAVDIDHPAVRRRPARDIDPESDLGALPVTVGVGRLAPADIARALENGAETARRLRAAGHIHGAVLTLKGAYRVIGGDFLRLRAPDAA